MTDFSGAVREALAAIPHGAKCKSYYLRGDTAFTERYACDCDREERIAQRVAEALEQMWNRGASVQKHSEPTRGAFRHDFADVVRALGGLS